MTDADIEYITSRLTGFHKLIPFVIGAVTIGVCTVNRTLVKCLPHLAIAIIAGVVFHCFFTGLGVTAFLFSSFAYVAACADASPSIDTFLKIAMPIGFGILWFIDLYVTQITTQSTTGEFPVLPYVATVLVSVLIGLFSVYSVTQLSEDDGKHMLYDFKGCSCDDCAQSNRCAANNVNGATNSKPKNPTRHVLMRRV
jgi:hypothetical protein